MYQNNNQKIKSIKYLLLDILTIFLALVLAYLLRHQFTFLYLDIYTRLAINMVIAQLVLTILMDPYKQIIQRPYNKEFFECIKYVIYLTFLALIYMFISQSSFAFSRVFLTLFFVLSIILLFIQRSLIKHADRERLYSKLDSQHLVIIGNKKDIEKAIKKVNDNIYLNYETIGVICFDSNDKYICDITNIKDFHDFVLNNVINEILLFYSNDDKYLTTLKMCKDMNLTIHNVIYENDTFDTNSYVQDLFNYTVLTSTNHAVNSEDLFVKRLFDILGSLVGLILTLILTIIIGPIIYFSDKGHIFYSQIRVGKNGKKFKMYKFRSMYTNADEIKNQYMKDNIMDGPIFKIDNDPRIIKGIGNFIRKTSLDEFPQFLNVLMGDMSLVGTRPPTVDEYEKYDFHHMSRLSIKPGITGLWQVSGRNDISDFDEIVRLDNEYINNWSLKLDIKILFETVFIVLMGKGAKNR